MASNFILVLSTFPDKKSALKTTALLLDKKLAACVNLLPGIESHYRWKGKREKSLEVLALIKTRKNLFPKLQKAVQASHPYEVPEIISLPLAAGNKAYLAWIFNETK